MKDAKVEKAVSDYIAAFIDALPGIEVPANIYGGGNAEIPDAETKVLVSCITLNHLNGPLWTGDLLIEIKTPKNSGSHERHTEILDCLDPDTGALKASSINIAALSAKLATVAGMTTSGWYIRDVRGGNDSEEWISEADMFLRLMVS